MSQSVLGRFVQLLKCAYMDTMFLKEIRISFNKQFNPIRGVPEIPLHAF